MLEERLFFKKLSTNRRGKSGKGDHSGSILEVKADGPAASGVLSLSAGNPGPPWGKVGSSRPLAQDPRSTDTGAWGAGLWEEGME